MRDLRVAFRALLKQPGFTTVAVLTIALGVGANSAIFSVVDAVMLRPLPFRNPATVVSITERTPQFPVLSLSPMNYADLCAGTQAFEACGAFRNTTTNLSGGDEPQRVQAKMISAGVLPMLGVAPVLGRPFTGAEDAPGGEPVALLSYALWQTRFGGLPTVLGERVLLDGRPCSIVGVLPAAFRLFQPADVYVPLGPFIAAQPPDRGWHPGILPVARLKAGVSLQQAQTEVAAVAARLEEAYPETNLHVGMAVTRTQDLMVQGVRTALLLLLGAVSGVLLIACINVAGLLLSRALARRRDLAVRIALGAGRGRIVSHLLAESLLISLAGGAAGLVLAAFTVPVLVHLVGPTLPRADMIGVDARVVAFTFLLAGATGLVFGLIPALQSTRVDVRGALTEGGRGGVGAGPWQRRTRRGLVIAEIALTVILTIGAALLIRSFARLQQVPTGFDSSHLLAADLPLSSVAYANDELRTGAVERVIERAAALPGVVRAAVTTQLPMTGGGATIHFNIEGHPPSGPEQVHDGGLPGGQPRLLRDDGRAAPARAHADAAGSRGIPSGDRRQRDHGPPALRRGRSPRPAPRARDRARSIVAMDGSRRRRGRRAAGARCRGQIRDVRAVRAVSRPGTPPALFEPDRCPEDVGATRATRFDHARGGT